MVDAVFKADWAAYHLEHAQYEVLTIAEHRARHKKGGKP
jgi:hypothetical protein